MKSLSLLFILWSGEGSFWIRNPHTALPEPVSDWLPLEFKMQKPTEPLSAITGQSTLKVPHSGTEITADVRAFWTLNQHQQDHSSIQILLKKGNKKIAECSFYFEPLKDQKFPGGACSGWLGIDQIGLTIRPK